MIRLMEVSIGKQITLHYALQDSLPLVDADTSQIQQVILNLITNANEAIGDQTGDITFSSGIMQADQRYLKSNLSNEPLPAGEYIYIEVADTGCGMNSDTIQKMFDPFFTTKFTGRGLGMSAVLGIIRGHHGAICVDTAPGKGTRFRILLPASDSVNKALDTSPQALPITEESQIPQALSGTILIVDDEEFIREIASVILEDMGFDIMEAVDGLEAIDIYQQYQDEIAMVLLDMTMPKMDGKACYAALKEINPDAKIVISSGYSKDEISSIFSQHQPTGFIHKPYMPESMQQIITEILSQSKPLEPRMDANENQVQTR